MELNEKMSELMSLEQSFFDYSRAQQASWMIFNSVPNPKNQLIGKKPVLDIASGYTPAYILTSKTFSPYFINLRDLGGVLFKHHNEIINAYNCFCDFMKEKVDPILKRLKTGEGLVPQIVISTAEAGNQWGAAVARDFNLGFAYMSSKIKMGVGQEREQIYGYIAGLTAIYCDDLFSLLTTTKKLVKYSQQDNLTILSEGFGIFNRKQYDNQVEIDLGIHLNSLLEIGEFIDMGLYDLRILDTETANMIKLFHEDNERYALTVVEENNKWIKGLGKKEVGKIIEGYINNNMNAVADALRDINF